MKKTKMRYINVSIPETLEDKVRNSLSELGGASNVSRFYGSLLIDGIEARLQKKGDTDGELHREIIRLRKREKQNSLITEIKDQLSIQQMTGIEDSEAWQELEESCEKHGFDLDTIVRNISSTIALPKIDSDSVLDRCMVWLGRKMEQDQSIPSKEVYALAEAEGFSRITLERAKARLGITSKRNGTVWEWSLSKSDNENVH